MREIIKPKITRYEDNPVLKPDPSIPWMSEMTMNPGLWYDGETFHMVFTARGDEAGSLCLGYAWSKDGKQFEVQTEPFLKPSANEADFDHGTVDDARITKLGDTYYIAYAARSLNIDQFEKGELRTNNPNDNPTWTGNFRRVGLLKSKDFKTIEKLGPVTSEMASNANVIYFPEKMNGKYVVLHRPSPFIPNTENIAAHPDFHFEIRIAFSDDLIHWYDDQPLAGQKFEWENQKIGGSGVPVKTEAGWLALYHGTYFGPDVHIRTYRVGVMLLDLDDPTKVIARAPDFIMESEEDYEKYGNHDHVVFPCANPVIDGIMHIYYGAADTACCLATVRVQELLDYVLQYKE